MSKYRKKPVEIEAVQFKPDGTREELDAMVQHLDGCTDWHMDGGDGAAIVIPTLEGEMLASPGDWVIKGVQGEFYPCKPDIFEATYEPEGVNRVQSSPVVDRDVIEEAVEAAAQDLFEGKMGFRATGPEYDSYKGHGEALDWARGAARIAVGAALPLIVKAERDRIKKRIEGLKFNQHDVDWNAALDRVLALLDEEARNE